MTIHPPPLRAVGDHGQCEAWDLVRTHDDAVSVRCPRPGRVIREKVGDRPRIRCVCLEHGLATAWEVS
jgi:hypothetical protein